MYNVQVSIKRKKVILKFFVLSVAREWNGNHFVMARKITHVKNVKRHIILESNRECSNYQFMYPMLYYRTKDACIGQLCAK